MSSDLELPAHIRHAGREYIRVNLRYHRRFIRNAESIQSCGKALKVSVAKVSTENLLRGVWFLKQAAPQLKSDIGRRLEPHFYDRRQIVKQPGKLCIVEHGTV